MKRLTVRKLKTKRKYQHLTRSNMVTPKSWEDQGLSEC